MSIDYAEAVPITRTIGLEEAAKFLHMAPSTLRKRTAAGKVPGYKPGRQWVFVPHEIEAYLKASAPACRSIDVKRLRIDPRWTTQMAGSDLARQIRAERRNLKPLAQDLEAKLRDLKPRLAGEQKRGSRS